MKMMFVDLRLDKILWAIKEDGAGILRGTSPNLESVRAHQKAQGVEWVKVDAKFRRREAEAASVLYGWEAVRHPMGLKEIEEAVGEAVSA